MITHKFSATNSAASPSVTTVPPARRNALLIGLGALLLTGMFSVAATANRPAAPAKDPVAAAQMDATQMMLESGDEATMESLTQLRDSDPKNAIYSYLIAAQYARHGAWQPAIAAMRAGNESPQLVLAKSADSRGSYPALSVLRQLVQDCATEASSSTSEETSEALLQESAQLAGRVARDAMPCDLNVLQTGGSLWRTIEQARIATWEKEERFADADTARARLAMRARWWKTVNNRISEVDTSDADVRIVAAKSLRAKIPL